MGPGRTVKDELLNATPGQDEQEPLYNDFDSCHAVILQTQDEQGVTEGQNHTNPQGDAKQQAGGNGCADNLRDVKRDDGEEVNTEYEL